MLEEKAQGIKNQEVTCSFPPNKAFNKQLKGFLNDDDTKTHRIKEKRLAAPPSQRVSAAFK